ncbi:calcium-binding protein, partial [Rhodobacter sp. Har01]|uniref:calcium-binding protein n=1 Tax=Rhodobacter sp. Har01 TaxID=2883999 RepID=UPI0039B6A6D3
MPLTFSILNGSTIETGPEIVRAITDSHFGGNVLVNNAERAQISSGWGFGRSIADANMKNLRYPGGTVTETLFDMTNPDAPMRGTTPLLWQTQFLQFASEIGASATIVIPTRCGFTQSAGASLVAGNYGHRAVSEEYSQSVQRYVFDTIRNAANQENPVRISCFEIGNEFWASGQMTASEYGKVAASALRAAQAGIDHAIAAGYVSSTSQPELLVQTISAAGYMSPNSSSDVYVSSGEVYQSISLIPEGQLYELATISGQGNARAQLLEIVRVLNDASVSHLIDGMVDHYYNASGFAQVDTGEQFIFQQFNYAEARLGREVGTLSRYVTEWNTKRTVDTSDGGRENNPEVAHNRGLPQAGMLVEMFFEMLTHGVTSANVWPLWFPSGNSTSLFDSETFATRVPSAIFQLMQESLIGTRPILDSEIEIDSVRLDSHFFSSDAKIVFFSQNRSEVPLHDFILGLDGLGDSTLRANLDTRQYFLAITELSSSLGGQFCSGANGEDVAPVLTYSNGAIGSGSLLQISMSNFTSTVDSLSAIDPMAILRVEITFISEGSDVIIGRAGNDTIFGGGGDDSILGSSGVDRLHGQAGNDTLEGGPGNDHLWGGEGADRLIGGDGQEIDYARYDDANWGNLIIRLDNPA